LIDEHTPDREGDVYAFIFILKMAISNQKDIRRERGRGNRKLLNLKHIYLVLFEYCILYRSQSVYISERRDGKKKTKQKQK
jgi:hypothetical protein